VRLNLRGKILVYSSCLLGLLVAVTLLFVSDRASTYANRQIALDLQQVRARITRIENERRVGLRESASLVASFPQLRALFDTDPATIADFLVSYQRQNERAELIVAMDRTGKIIARTDFGSSPPDAHFHDRWIRPVLDQGYADGVFLAIDGAYDAVAVAAEVGGEVFGFVLAAAAIDDAFAAQLGSGDSEVALIGNDVLGSTLAPDSLPGRTVEYWSGGAADGAPRDVSVLGERFVAATILVSDAPPVLVVVMQSWDRATATYRSIQLGLFVLGLLVTGLGVAGSAWFARTITAPIAKLVEGTREVAHGNLDYRLDVQGGDEIGDLGASFNTMLDERQRLERRFQESQKLEAVGRLAGGVAHDFNDLLMVISGRARTLVRSLPDHHPMHDHARRVRDSAERGSALTRQLLAFSRRQVLQPRVLDLDELLVGMEPVLDALVGDGVELRLDLSSPRQLVKADPGQVEQIVLNLAMNARDAMPHGGHLTIATTTTELRGRRVGEHLTRRAGTYRTLTVSDTGTGIEDEIRDQLFEPFFTTKEAGQGTGLGLSTVYGIVQQSGGHIEVSSELGRGTVFRVYLPVEAGAVPATVVASEPASSAVSTSSQGSETILLVEDDPDVCALVGEFLRDSGYTVLLAPDGPSAMAASDGCLGEIHLLITDVMLPRLSGPELAEHLRRDRPRLLVLFISGYTPTEAVPPDGAPYLQKPFSDAELLPRVRSLLDATEP
jgi:signal transduction histidine kinase/CheY-like chemotaxis protein